jgi:hypothetical protein
MEYLQVTSYDDFRAKEIFDSYCQLSLKMKDEAKISFVNFFQTQK